MGSETVEYSDEADISQSSDLSMSSVAVWATHPVSTPAENMLGLSSQLRGDVWVNEMTVAENGYLVAPNSARTGGIRGMLELDWKRPGGITPKARVGVLHDLGLGDTGTVVGLGLH